MIAIMSADLPHTLYLSDSLIRKGDGEKYDAPTASREEIEAANAEAARRNAETMERLKRRRREQSEWEKVTPDDIFNIPSTNNEQQSWEK